MTAAFLALPPGASALVALTNRINPGSLIVTTNAAYGAAGNGIMTNTTAIQNAINAATLGARPMV